jgi:hypothetical protein
MFSDALLAAGYETGAAEQEDLVGASTSSGCPRRPAGRHCPAHYRRTACGTLSKKTAGRETAKPAIILCRGATVLAVPAVAAAAQASGTVDNCVRRRRWGGDDPCLGSQ